MTTLARSARQAFTLIELLVVVAVISLLIGILLPALGMAREAGRETQCRSGIRQLQIANDLYASNKDERYVPGAARIQSENRDRWHGSRDGASGPFRAGAGPITEYLDGGGASEVVRSCPTFRPRLESLAERGQGFETSCGGYGYNNAFVGVERMPSAGGLWLIRTDEVGSRRTRFASPARTIAFADAAFATDDVIEYSFIEPRWWPEYPDYRPDPSVHFRHGHSAMVAWLDGHVSGEERTFTEASGFYDGDPDALGIGWFGLSDDNSLFDYR